MWMRQMDGKRLLRGEWVMGILKSVCFVVKGEMSLTVEGLNNERF